MILRFLKWVGFLILAAVASVWLALASEGLAYKYGSLDGGTPGMIIANRLVPAGSGDNLMVIQKWSDIMLEVDALIWFVILCGIAATVVIVRRSRRRRVPK